MPKSTRVTVVDLPQDDSWFRDTGPVVSTGTSARESYCKSSANLAVGSFGKHRAWSPSGQSSHLIVQFVVRRDEGGRNVAIRGNDFVFNSWGHKNVTWDVDDEIADWVRSAQCGQLLWWTRSFILILSCQCCRSYITRALRGTGRSLCSRVARSMSMAKGALP